MGTTTANGLRVLTAAEKKAAELHGRGAAMRSIIIQTGLSQQQIDAAVERSAGWDELRAQTARAEAKAALMKAKVPAPVAEPGTADFDEILADAIVAADAQAPIVVHVIDRETGAEVELPAEPEAVDWDAALADDDGTHPDELTPAQKAATGTDALLARAEASVQPRVRQLAAAVRIQLTELASLLDSDEKVRALTIAAEVLRRQLAQTEAELAELMGPAPTTPATPATALAPASRTASTSAIRAWAIANGWEVPVRGILRGAVVAAYNAAHGGTS